MRRKVTTHGRESIAFKLMWCFVEVGRVHVKWDRCVVNGTEFYEGLDLFPRCLTWFCDCGCTSIREKLREEGM
jgi:hypothetical protein